MITWILCVTGIVLVSNHTNSLAYTPQTMIHIHAHTYAYTHAYMHSDYRHYIILRSSVVEKRERG